MTVRAALLFSATVLGLSAGCAGTPPEPMRLCSELYVPPVEPEALPANPEAMRVALVKAQQHANRVYGPDCIVCAEILDSQEGTISLHITNQYEDLLINTSAGIKVRASDGKVLEKKV